MVYDRDILGHIIRNKIKMRAMSFQDRGVKAPVVAAAGLCLASAGLISNGLAMADTTSVTDTVNVTVESACTFNSIDDETYAGSAVNGAEVENFNDSGVHEFNLFCNNNSGFTVTATPYDLEATGITGKISYTDSYATSGTDGLWTAAIASSNADLVVSTPVPVGGGTIITSSSHTATGGVDFTAAYDAYVGTTTSAGTYTGTIVYTLVPSGSTNSGSSSSTNSSSSESSTGSESSGESSGTSSTEGTLGTTSTGTTINNTYSTYNTYNTTNTTSTNNSTNNSGTTSTTGETTSEDDDDDADSSYVTPLGVTSTTKSSSGDSGTIDPTPIIIAGALVIAGLSAVALIKNSQEEEN